MRALVLVLVIGTAAQAGEPSTPFEKSYSCQDSRTARSQFLWNPIAGFNLAKEEREAVRALSRLAGNKPAKARRNTSAGRDVTVYVFPGLSVVVPPHNPYISDIEVTSSRFELACGLRIGEGADRFMKVLGKPDEEASSDKIRVLRFLRDWDDEFPSDGPAEFELVVDERGLVLRAVWAFVLGH